MFKLPSTDTIARGSAHGERETITGVWERSPSGAQGQSPWSGGQGAKPPKAESLLSFQCPMKAAKFTPLTNWQTDFCHVCSLLHWTGFQMLPSWGVRSEDCRIRAAEGPGWCLVNVHILNKIGQIVLQLWPWMSLHWKDAHCTLLVWHVSHVSIRKTVCAVFSMAANKVERKFQLQWLQ